ncbi:MAG: fibronectin type III domain-containing protein [Lachnospiraceae bacterium]|nr:fibronectin type III domain-containing protein [Lachnospiraceae bacterium]
MYKAADFTSNEDGTYSVVVDDPAMEMGKAAEVFASLLIDVVGTNFEGDIDISDLALNNPNELWSADGGETNEVEFGEAEDWDTWDNTLKANFDGNNKEIPKDAVMKFTMTVDKTAYETLGETGYIKMQAVFFTAKDDWDTVVKLGWPMYDAKKFTVNDDGTYSTEVEMSFGEEVTTFQSVLIQCVGTLFTGKATISDLSITKPEAEDVFLTPQDPTVVADFETGIDGWAGEAGYDYSHGKADPSVADGKANEAAEAAWDEDSQSLKMTVDYSKDTATGWSEAKVKGTFDAVAVSNYNLVSFTLRYPSDMETVRTKLFMSDTTGEVEVLNSEGSFRSKTVKDLENGWSTVTIRGEFKPKDVKVDNLTIGIVGPYAALKNVYIDDVTIGQLDASEDYVEITEEVKENGDKADITKMAKSVKLVDAEATAATKALAAYLAGLQASDQVLFGHQNSSFRSVRDNGVTSDIKDITGSEAGLFGIDTLALAGNEVSKKTRQEALDASIAATKKAYNGGSIITLSCHMPNFTNSKIKATGDEKYPYDFTGCDFSESKDLTPCADYILEGGEYNPQFNAYLDIIADYALALQEDGIPVLFRPFHENSGGWFWWGTSTSVESYKAMWRYMVNYLQDKGVHNFLYVYSPNGPFTSSNVYLERWPGDAYVDVIGFDYYDDYANVDVYTGDNFFEALAASCQVVAGIAEEKDKIPAIAETGIRITGAGKDSLMVTGNPTTGHDWYNKVINTAVDNGIPYFLLWANFDSGNFFVPFKYNDTLGQEMINEFISSYNNEKSIFGNVSNFYTSGDNGAADAAISKAGSVTLTGYSTEVTGYMIAPKDYAVIKEAYSLKASVKNAKKVSFEIRTSEDAEPLTIEAKKAESGNVYTADLTDAILADIEQTSTGIVKLIADGQTLGQAKFINFNKEADVMPQYIIDNFEYYYGSDGLLQSKWGSANTAAGCSATIALSDTKVEGDYSGAFSYELAYKGSEVWAGGLGRVFDADKTDFSEYNAISMWVKPDGNGQKMVIQLNDNYEAYLTEFVKGTKAQYVTIPFSKFIKKGGTETVDPSNLTSFKLWCNSVPDNYTGDKDDKGNYTVSGTILFDDIKAVEISEEDLEKVNENGLIISDEALKDLSNEKRADKKAAAKVTEAIEAIKDVKYDDASKKAIEDARKAYDALTDAQKKLVSADTLKKLEAAEKSYADQKKAAEDAAANATEADKKAAADVTAAIEAIKDVQYNDASKAAIEAARKAYDALTDAQKALISADTLKKLTDAEATYAQKKAEAENPVKTPVLEATKNATNAITVKWTATEGAAGYNVYVATKKTYAKVGSTSSTSYKINKVNKKKLKAATAYRVKVVAYDKDNKEIAGSELELATATSPAKVKISSLSRKSSAKATLKWKKVTGASGYEVYMKTGSGKYKLVKTIKKGKTVSYTQSKLKKGKKYTFKVRAYKTAGGKKVYGAYSKTKSIQLK